MARKLIEKTMPTKHLPDIIQRALKAARTRPVRKGCFRSAAKAVAFQIEVPLEYVEGWAVRDGVPIAHAWVRHITLGDVDLLLNQADYTYQPLLVLSPVEVRRRMTGTWGPWAPELLAGATGGKAR